MKLTDEARDNHTQLIERAEIASLVRSRMDSLGIDTLDYDDVSEKRSSLSYVIINPSCDLKLEEGDIMYDLSNYIKMHITFRLISSICILKFVFTLCQLPDPTESILGSEDVRTTQQSPSIAHQHL